MTKKIILSAVLGLAFIVGGQAQEKKNVKVKKEVSKQLQHPEANVNFDEIQNPETMGIDEFEHKTMSIDGMIVGNNQQSYPLNIEKKRVLSFEFKSDNPQAMYYIQDRLENIIVPATDKSMKEELRPGQYILKVGLTPEAVKKNEKATYSIVIQ